jgi:glucose 1-dehydrogenase
VAAVTGRRRSVIVTGASSGIGAEVARAFGRQQADVVLVGRNQRRLGRVAVDVRESGGRAASTVVDLADAAEVPGIVALALEAFGRIDALVHCAGLWVRQSVDDTTSEAFDLHWKVHVRSPFLLTQAALPHLRPGASILFLTSQASQIGIPDTVAYTASKGAVTAMARVLAVELASREVRVNCIAPGLVKTPMNELTRREPAFQDLVRQTIPLGRMGSVAEVAPLAVFLTSDDATFVTGASFAVDGGRTIV